MIVARLQGGMGNQMFQYALARRLAAERGTEVGLDLTTLLDRTPHPDFVFRDYDLDLFKVRARVLAEGELRDVVGVPRGRLQNRREVTPHLNRWRRFWSRDAYLLVKERGFGFDPEVLALEGNLYLDGYWQSPRYFAPIASALAADFALQAPLPARVQELADRIGAVNSLCINVRRADFVALAAAARLHGACDRDYFERALAAIVPRIGAPEIFVTSDDVPWCRENLRFGHPTTFLDHDWAGPRFSHYLALMVRCRHFIIPNSTFAWWAAWLSTSPGKVVVAPQVWFRGLPAEGADLLPAEWLRV